MSEIKRQLEDILETFSGEELLEKLKSMGATEEEAANYAAEWKQ